MASGRSCPNFVSFKLLDEGHLMEKPYFCT